MKKFKPEDFGLSLTEKIFLDNDYLKQANIITKRLDNDWAVKYSHHIYNEPNYVANVFIAFKKSNKLIGSITSVLNCKGGFALEFYHGESSLSKSEFLEKISNKKSLFEWCLWNV